MYERLLNKYGVKQVGYYVEKYRRERQGLC